MGVSADRNTKRAGETKILKKRERDVNGQNSIMHMQKINKRKENKIKQRKAKGSKNKVSVSIPQVLWHQIYRLINFEVSSRGAKYGASGKNRYPSLIGACNSVMGKEGRVKKEKKKKKKRGRCVCMCGGGGGKKEF